MNRKEYLLQLVKKRAADIGGLGEQIVSGIDRFSDEKIEKLIAAFEQSEERKKRIAAGEAVVVIEELKREHAQKKGDTRKSQVKSLREKEAASRSHDEAEAEALLKDLENITENES